jgi:transposase InsO family protein
LILVLASANCFRILAIVDDFTRECLALVADTLLPGLRVARELDAVIARRGRPSCSSEFVHVHHSHEFDAIAKSTRCLRRRMQAIAPKST